MVDVNRPPRITIAIGPSISRPGAPAPKASGSSPSAVTSAVIENRRETFRRPPQRRFRPPLHALNRYENRHRDHAAPQKGTDVDKPRNLAKSVTVE